MYDYKLVSETLPNGHIVRYVWNDHNQLEAIYTSNRDGSKIFARVDIRINGDQSILTGSDERSLVLNMSANQIQIISPEFSTQTICLEPKPLWIDGKKFTNIYLKSLSLPKNRTVHIDYGEIEDTNVRHNQTESRKREIDQKIQTLKLKNKEKYQEKIARLKNEKNVINNLGIVDELFPKQRFVKTLLTPIGTDESLKAAVLKNSIEKP